jgi:YVTN family beta-propeller protein
MKRWVVLLLVMGWIGFGFRLPVHAETHAYIPDLGGGQVVRVATEDETIASVALTGDPYGAAVTPDGRRVFVTRTAAAMLTAIATDTFATIGSQVHITVGAAPRGVAVTSDGRYAFVANFDDNTVSRITVASLQVTDTINVGNGPWGVAAFWDEHAGHRAYVTNHLDNSVTVITTEGTTTITDVGDGPVGVALTPDGRWLYVANHNEHTVAVIRTSDHSLFDVINVGNGPWGVAMGLQGRSVFVTNSLSNSVSAIRTEDNIVERTYLVGQRPRGVAAPVNGDFAYVINSNSNNVTRVDHVSRTLETILANGFNSAVALGAFIGGPLPQAPTALSARSESPGRIELSWTDNADDELGFAIERRRESDDSFVEIARVSANVTRFSDLGLTRETTYFYRVRAFNETGYSGYSAAAQATTEDGYFAWCFIGTLLGR